VARKTLDRVIRQSAYATLALSGELARSELSPADRGLATEIVYGVLRHKSRLDRALESAAEKKLKVAPKIRIALWVAAYQMLFLDRVPDHAAVDDAVLAVKKVAGARMAGFANALLRTLARQGEPPFSDVSEEFSTPRWIVERLRAEVGGEELASCVAAFAKPGPLWARANRLKTTRDELCVTLQREWPQATVEAGTLTEDSVLIVGGGAPDGVQSFRDGLWTVQDVGAQAVGELFEATPGRKILDACAGVGGKTTHAAERARDLANIVAVDSSPRKLALLEDACERLGIQRIQTVCADITQPEAEFGGGFDIVLLDAPCTGLGVLRRHPEAKWRLQEEDIAKMAALQQKMLHRLSEAVAPGGILVYSVCSFTSEEGPRRVEAFLQDHSDFRVEKTLRTWPHRDNADAFYGAVLRRQ
jgi:16S rRNA (cytosine967-C5)-methyltransferase